MAGYRELLAVEWNNNAVETFKLNFPDVPVYHGDITKLSVKECMKLAGLSGLGELDLLDGSPPCQGFSTIGKRRMKDSRNQLFMEFARLLRGLRPKVFVMENVSGLIKGKMKLIFVEILKELKACGYLVSARLLNAMYFNVPQSRERLIFIGVRDDLGIRPSHPKAENIPLGCKIINSEILASRSMKINAWIESARSAATITKTKSDYQFLTSSGIRRPYLNEIKMLSSYPEGAAGGWAQIGNSVPPLFMRSIANHIKVNILGQMEQAGLTPAKVSNKSYG